MTPPIEAFEIFFIVLLLLIGLALIRTRHLFAAAMLTSVYSLVSAAWFVVLDAVDVAFTEAAVGAGISGVLMLVAMLLTARHAKRPPPGRRYGPFFVTFAVGAVLFYAIGDMPVFGDPNAPVNAYVGRDYLQRAIPETGVPNVVTAVLASYRGYDTLGETLVIFAAGLAVLLLLGFGTEKREDAREKEEDDSPLPHQGGDSVPQSAPSIRSAEKEGQV